MLTLYYRPTCPFSRKVLLAAKDAGIGLQVCDIDEQVHYDELMRMGGKAQVPFLVDKKRGAQLYEADDIIAYLNEHCRPENVS